MDGVPLVAWLAADTSCRCMMGSIKAAQNFAGMLYLCRTEAVRQNFLGHVQSCYSCCYSCYALAAAGRSNQRWVPIWQER